ncbi:MAG TPA: hypothetical protein VF744_07390, partial [Beijerinckiaceae bacterium]
RQEKARLKHERFLRNSAPGFMTGCRFREMARPTMTDQPTDLRDASVRAADALPVVTPAKRIGSMMERVDAPRGA